MRLPDDEAARIWGGARDPQWRPGGGNKDNFCNDLREIKKFVSPNQLQKQVEKGQAPKIVDRVDKPHVPGQKSHIHFKDGTSLNIDGSIHDVHKGVPRLAKEVKDWIIKNGWEVNE